MVRVSDANEWAMSFGSPVVPEVASSQRVSCGANEPGGFGGLKHRFGFADGGRDRLFAEEVFSRFRGLDGSAASRPRLLSTITNHLLFFWEGSGED